MPLSPPRLTAPSRLMEAGAVLSLSPWQLVLLSTITNAILAEEVQTVL